MTDQNVATSIANSANRLAEFIRLDAPDNIMENERILLQNRVDELIRRSRKSL
jgi:DNA-directed RNA polymerase beta' subunit